MKKLFMIMAMATLIGCQTTEPMYSDTNSNDPNAGIPPSSFAHFTDIPIPVQAVMNLDKTVILGSGEDWTGKLSFISPYGTSRTFDFFVEELPKFGWRETAVVRANVSFMTYNRKGRELIVQIHGEDDEAIVEMMVSPEKRAK